MRIDGFEIVGEWISVERVESIRRNKDVEIEWGWERVVLVDGAERTAIEEWGEIDGFGRIVKE